MLLPSEKMFKGNFDVDVFEVLCLFKNFVKWSQNYSEVSVILSISFCFFRGKWFSFTCCVVCSEGTTCPLKQCLNHIWAWGCWPCPFLFSYHVPGHLVFEAPSPRCRLNLLAHCPACATPHWEHFHHPYRCRWPGYAVFTSTTWRYG